METLFCFGSLPLMCIHWCCKCPPSAGGQQEGHSLYRGSHEWNQSKETSETRGRHRSSQQQFLSRHCFCFIYCCECVCECVYIYVCGRASVSVWTLLIQSVMQYPLLQKFNLYDRHQILCVFLSLTKSVLKSRSVEDAQVRLIIHV